MNSYYLYARPRSGISWVRYICRELYGLPSISAHQEDSPAQLFQKTHASEDLIESRFLLCMVRDYKECLVRHYADRDIKDIDYVYELGHEGWGYMKYLTVYNDWVGPKLLLYYEGFMEHPESSISILGDQIGASKEKVLDFINNLEHHQKKSIELYNTKGDESATQGKKIDHHKYKLSYEQRDTWDKYLDLQYPDLYNKYLKRYAEIKI